MDISAMNIVVTAGNPDTYWPNKPDGEDVNTKPFGYSGGPVYRVDEQGKRPFLELVGFIYEFSFEPVMLARHADLI